MEESKRPGLDYLYLLKVFAKREEYLKHRRSELLEKLNDCSNGPLKYDSETDNIISQIDGALSEIGFISQIIYLIGGNDEI